jgi:hypothetical protein
MIQLINMLSLLINKCFVIINYYFYYNNTDKNLVKITNDNPNYNNFNKNLKTYTDTLNNLENDWHQFVELD